MSAWDQHFLTCWRTHSAWEQMGFVRRLRGCCTSSSCLAQYGQTHWIASHHAASAVCTELSIACSGLPPQEHKPQGWVRDIQLKVYDDRVDAALVQWCGYTAACHLVWNRCFRCHRKIIGPSTLSSCQAPTGWAITAQFNQSLLFSDDV